MKVRVWLIGFLITNMQHRILPKLCRTHILLGELYPKLIALRDSRDYGDVGKLELNYKGFKISWSGEELPIDAKKFNQEIGTEDDPNRFNEGTFHGG